MSQFDAPRVEHGRQFGSAASHSRPPPHNNMPTRSNLTSTIGASSMHSAAPPPSSRPAAVASMNGKQSLTLSNLARTNPPNSTIAQSVNPQSQQRGGMNQSTKSSDIPHQQRPPSTIPPSQLHPNHIHEVFPDAVSALAKTEEHAYSSSHNAAMHEMQLSHAAGQRYLPAHAPPSHTHSHNLNHHAPHIFPSNTSGMADSTQQYAVSQHESAAGGESSSDLPHLSSTLALDRVIPLQRENLRLVRTNNTLQQHLIAEAERIEESEQKWDAELRVMKTKYSELQFAMNQRTRKITNQEQKIHELQSRLEQVLADRHTFIKESFEIPVLLTSQSLNPPPTRPQPSQSQIEVMRAMEYRVNELQEQLTAVMKEKESWTQERDTYESKVATRDEQISRLSEMISQERNWDAIHVDHELKSKSKQILKLESHIDFLNGEREKWEKDRKNFAEMGVNSAYIESLNSLQSHNKQLEASQSQSQIQISSLQRQVKSLEAELQQKMKNYDEHASEKLQTKDRDMQALKQKYDALLKDHQLGQLEYDKLQTQYDAMRAQLPNIDVSLLQDNLKREEIARTTLREQYNKLVVEHDALQLKYTQATNELTSLKDTSQRDITNLTSDVHRLQTLNSDFSRRLADLTSAKHSLTDESGSLKHKLTLQQRQREGLYEECEYYKTQINEMQHQVKDAKAEREAQETELQYLRRSNEQLELKLKESLAEASKLLSEQSHDHIALQKLESDYSHLQSEYESLQRANENLNELVVERNSLISERTDLNVEQRSLARQNEKMKTQIEALSSEKAHLFDRVASITRERDALLQSLSSTDANLLQIQNDIADLNREREVKESQYTNLYNDFVQVTEELSEMKGKKHAALQSQYQALTVENERLQGELKKLQNETLQSLTTTEAALRADLLNMKTAYSDLNAMYEKEQDRGEEYSLKIATLEAQLASAQTSSATRTTQLESNTILLSHHTDMINKLNQQISELKSMTRTIESQRSKVELEWKAAQQECDHLRSELHSQMSLHTSQTMLLQEKQQEVLQYKEACNVIREEKQALEIAMHELAQRMQKYEHEIQLRHLNTNQLQSTLQETHETSSSLRETLRAKEYEIAELIKQLNAGQLVNTKVQEELNLKTNDFNSILQDLENLIKENQILMKELNTSKMNVGTRTEDVERLQAKVHHLEESYRAKEMELYDLLTNYRSVTLENERLKVAMQELEGERVNYRATLKQQQDALFKHDSTIRQHESELRKRMIDIQTLEHTVQDLTRSLESTKKSVDHVHNERNQLEYQLESSRSLAGGMEQSRADHVRLVAEYKAQITKLQNDLHALQLDNTNLIQALRETKEHSNNLDRIIAELRGQQLLLNATNTTTPGEQINSDLELELHTKTIELSHLKEQIEMLNQYREKQNRDMNRLLDSPSTASSSATALPTSNSPNKSSLLTQIGSLQSVIDTQFVRLQEFSKERTKLKTYILKYERELRAWEEKYGAQPQAMQTPQRSTIISNEVKIVVTPPTHAQQ